MKFPNNLKYWRLKSKKTQEDLARVLASLGDTNANKQKIWKIEAGNQRIRLDEALAFAKFLNCQVDDIISDISSVEGHELEDFLKEKDEKHPGAEAARFLSAYYKAFSSLSPDAQERVQDHLRLDLQHDVVKKMGESTESVRSGSDSKQSGGKKQKGTI